jgi:hypothetical protein
LPSLAAAVTTAHRVIFTGSASRPRCEQNSCEAEFIPRDVVK